MISCKEVIRKIASDEVADAPFLQRLVVRLHLLMCRYCRRYAKQLRTIGALTRKAWCLGDEDRGEVDRLKKNILEGFIRRGSKATDSEETHDIPRDGDNT